MQAGSSLNPIMRLIRSQHMLPMRHMCMKMLGAGAGRMFGIRAVSEPEFNPPWQIPGFHLPAVMSRSRSIGIAELRRIRS